MSLATPQSPFATAPTSFNHISRTMDLVFTGAWRQHDISRLIHQIARVVMQLGVPCAYIHHSCSCHSWSDVEPSPPFWLVPKLNGGNQWQAGGRGQTSCVPALPVRETSWHSGPCFVCPLPAYLMVLSPLAVHSGCHVLPCLLIPFHHCPAAAGHPSCTATLPADGHLGSSFSHSHIRPVAWTIRS